MSSKRRGSINLRDGVLMIGSLKMRGMPLTAVKTDVFNSEFGTIAAL